LSAVGQYNTHHFEIFAFEKYEAYLENRVKGHLRLLKMTPFDRSYM